LRSPAGERAHGLARLLVAEQVFAQVAHDVHLPATHQQMIGDGERTGLLGRAHLDGGATDRADLPLGAARSDHARNPAARG
jgi:hypothetical protein